MLDASKKSCLPCGLHQPMRNHYFDGKFLVARDFSDEQDYARGHRQMHNAYLHGTGTVCGLKLIEHPSETCRRDFVVCEPGIALDCCGQEIVVPERALVRVRDMIAADEDLQAALDGDAHLFIAIERCDAGAEPVPVILPACDGDGDGATECGRIAEGYRFRLFARSPAEVAPVEVPIRPVIDWVHAFSYDGATPRAVHVNAGETLVQIAMDDPTATNTYAYDLATHDLQAVLGGPATASDTASSREGRLVFVAGAGFDTPDGPVNGVGVWHADTMRTRPAPAGIIRTAGPRPRIAVSPASGTLYVLDIDGNNSRLISYTSAALTDWLPATTDPDGTPPAADQPETGRVMEFGHGFGTERDAAGRGAAMMEMTRDGRFLAVIGPVGAPRDRLYLIDTASFAGGGLTPENARPDGFARPGTERLEAIRWSYDDAYLYVLTRQPAAGGTLLLNRYALVDEGARLERAGSGVTLAGRGFDMALAPTETRAYLLLADADGVTRFSTVDLEPVKTITGGDTPTEIGLSPDSIRFDGSGRCLTPTPSGSRIYAAIADDGEGPPDRGLVAVIDIAEEDCTLKFDALIDGCAGCADDDHAVVLGHVPGYVHDPADGPRIRNADTAEDGDVALDNLTYRPIVPSAATLKAVIECIVAQGVAEGPPGPRGDTGRDGVDGADGADGRDGDDGRSITTVNVALGAPGTDPAAATSENATGLTLDLTVPAAADGTDGLGIDDATIDYVDGLPAPEVAIVPQGGQRVLAIRLPAPAPGGGLEPGNAIVGISWVHDAIHPVAPDHGSFAELLAAQGIAIAFERPVLWRHIRADLAAGPTMVAELQIPVSLGGGLVHWATAARLNAHPITEIQRTGTLLTNWTILEGAEEAEGFALRGPLDLAAEFDRTLPFRVVFHADFAVTADGIAVDGNHVGGELPTGPAGPGNTFRSWFRFGRG